MRACSACFSVFAGNPDYCLFDGQPLADENALFGRVLDSYRIDQLIGVGATGCVFRGENVKTGEPCAIKFVYGEIDGVHARFRREIDAVSVLNHPNIVKIVDSGLSPAGLTYMVMELLDGPTLRAVIEEEAPLDERRVRRYARQLIAGLAEAHGRGFVHRDLKPGNIVVTRDSAGNEQIKILDFGIVSSLYGRMTDDRLTRTGFIVGTPTYMAPEQIDAKSVTPEADIYALGVILYELLTGSPPFDGSIEHVLVKKLTVVPEPVPDGGDFGALILAMLDARPERRPANGVDISASLSRISQQGADLQTSDLPLVHPQTKDLLRASPDDSLLAGLFDQTAVDPAPRGSSDRAWDASRSDVSVAPSARPEVFAVDADDGDPTVRGQADRSFVDTEIEIDASQRPCSNAAVPMGAISVLRPQSNDVTQLTRRRLKLPAVGAPYFGSGLTRGRADSWDKLNTRMITDESAGTPARVRGDADSAGLVPTTTLVVLVIISTVLVFLLLALLVHLW